MGGRQVCPSGPHEESEAFEFVEAAAGAEACCRPCEVEAIPGRSPVQHGATFAEEGIDLERAGRTCPDRRPELCPCVVLVRGFDAAPTRADRADCERGSSRPNGSSCPDVLLPSALWWRRGGGAGECRGPFEHEHEVPRIHFAVGAVAVRGVRAAGCARGELPDRGGAKTQDRRCKQAVFEKPRCVAGRLTRQRVEQTRRFRS